MDSLEGDLKNYKSLYEEIAQNDSNVYLNHDSLTDVIRYADGDEETPHSCCCCCKVHRRRNSSFITGGAVTTTTTSTRQPFNTNYNTIWIGEMKNATDYIEYLNETRRNSFSSLNKDNRSNYYQLMLGNDNHLTLNSSSAADVNNNKRNSHNSSNKSNTNFLQVPPRPNIDDEHLRRTPEFDNISKKIDEIHQLDASVSSLIYKSIEVHADILVSATLTATVG